MLAGHGEFFCRAKPASGIRSTACPGESKASAATNLRTFEVDLDAVDRLDLPTNLPSGAIQAFRNFMDLLIDDRMEAAFGKDIDQHLQCQRVSEDRIFGIHDRPA